MRNLRFTAGVEKGEIEVDLWLNLEVDSFSLLVLVFSKWR